MTRFNNTRFTSTVLGSALGVLLGVGSAFGNPLDPTVVVGSATFETAGAQLNVTNSSGAIIDWNSFSIGQDEITKFIQQSSSSAVLNRVTGGDLSEILGSLQSNGLVFLINPNGLLFGEGAVVDTAGFIGSTLDITNQAFSSENYTFSGDGGAIENRGLIHVTGNGDIALIATSVENSGILRSDNGDILLAAGNSVSVSFDDLQNLSFEVQAPEKQAVNLGDIIAGGGNASLLGGQVVNSGNVELVESPDGRIFLQASDTAIVSGSLDSNSGDIHIEARQVELRNASIDSGSADVSGNISLLGDNVGLFAGTKLSASGNNGGGTILIGGEQQGRGDTRTSEFVYLDENASVEANGGNTGNGGRVVLFAEDSATINGAVSARGGEQSGDGGFIETSGLIGLSVNATPNAGANNGAPGEWLIDPNNITIEDGENFETGTTMVGGVFTSNAAGAVIFSSTLEEALAISDVTIDTGTTGTEDGNISINAAIQSSTGDRGPLTTSLTLNAANDIYVNASVELIGTNRTLQFNSGLEGGAGTSLLGSGALEGVGDANSPRLAATTIEFLGGGLTLQEASPSFDISTQTLNVVGGLDQTGSVLDLRANSVSIDEFIITSGAEGTLVIADGNNNIDIDSLHINSIAEGLFSTPPIEFRNGGNYTLFNGGAITLQASPFGMSQTEGGSAGQVTFSGNLVNQGSLDISGEGLLDFGLDSVGMPIEGSLSNQSGATINISGGIVISSDESSIVNNGNLNITQSSNVDGPSGDLELPGNDPSGGGDLTAGEMPGDLGGFGFCPECPEGPPVYIDGDLQNSGVVTVGPSAVLLVESVQNSGQLNIEAASLLQTGSLSLNQGEVHFEDGGILAQIDENDLTVGDGSSITGNGVIITEGVVFVESGGIIAPGNSPGAILIDGGGLTLFDGAILNIELAGPNPGDFDLIDVAGDLNVGGPGMVPASAPGVVLNVSNLGDYDPDPLVSHDIIQVGGIVDQTTPFNQSASGFDTLNIAFVGNTLGLLVSVTPPPVETPPVETPPVVTAPPVVTPPPAVTPPVETPPVVTPPVETPPVVTAPPAVVTPTPEVATIEEPAIEEPLVEMPATMTPPNDIINDVVVFAPGRTEFRGNNPRGRDAKRPDTERSDSEERDEEIRSFTNQCR